MMIVSADRLSTQWMNRKMMNGTSKPQPSQSYPSVFVSLSFSRTRTTTTAMLPTILWLLLSARGVKAFALQHHHPNQELLPPQQQLLLKQQCRRKPAFFTPITTTTPSTSTPTQLYMVFDFFRKRSEEGFDQLSNLADSASKGQLGRGLIDAAAYSANANQAFAAGLSKSRNRLLQNLESLMTGTSPPDEWLDELEDVLLQADLGTSTTEDIIAEVGSLRDSDSVTTFSRDDLMSILRGKLIEAFDIDRGATVAVAEEEEEQGQTNPIQFSTDESLPTVLFIMGANGMGKTTTIGKLAHRLKTEGNQTVLMAACDTFRAGAVEQLQQWADRSGADMVGPDEQAKTPAAVLYKALDIALSAQYDGDDAEGKSKLKYDTVLVDTSGRLSNNDSLTAELAKMKRVIQKRLSVANGDDGKPTLNDMVPHETLLVLDAAQGRMALDSAKVWNKEVGLTGLILTKLDGSARGGSVVSISRDLQLPVKLIGVGEGIEDLRDFERDRFVDGLLGIGSAGGRTVSSFGGSSSSSSSKKSEDEGKMLAARLKEMRKERDARAKTIMVNKKKEMAVAPSPSVVGSSGTAVTATNTATQPNNTRRKPKPNKNKKKKRKSRK